MVFTIPEEPKKTFIPAGFAKTLDYMNLDEQIEQAKHSKSSSDANIRRLAGLKLMDLYDAKYGEN